jgi:hypothetical protein
MIKVILKDGSIYIGEDVRDIIVQLKLEDWTSYNNPEEYQKNIARRVENFNGSKITYHSEDEFLQELKRIGFIKQIQK